MNKKPTIEEKNAALKTLRKYCKPGTTIYTIHRHVARSGMSRCIDLYVYRNNKPIRLSHCTATVLEEKLDRKWASICVSGCGMDMGFDLVYRLSHALHGTGYSLQHQWQ